MPAARWGVSTGTGRGSSPESQERMNQLPRILITQGDVAGIGPEIIVKAWPELTGICRPVVVGDPRWLSGAHVQVVSDLADAQPARNQIPCLVGSDQNLGGVVPGRISAAAGRAAYD